MEMGENSPLISKEASGFMSRVSICESPPERKMKMTDFAFGEELPAAASTEPNRPRFSPSSPSAPARIMARRFKSHLGKEGSEEGICNAGTDHVWCPASGARRV